MMTLKLRSLTQNKLLKQTTTKTNHYLLICKHHS